MASDVDTDLLDFAQSRVGRVLCGKYRIEAVLGVGGMAAVYSASHRNGRRVALKVLHPELSIRPELRRRFLREGHAATVVKHPGAVVVLDDDVAEDGSAFLVMELLDGCSIEELWELNGRRLAPKTVLAVGRELSDVLIAAHRAGVVHRDIKPANVFVTRDAVLKVLDFGIARLRDIAPSATQTGTVLGTPAFMAPEQAQGRTSKVDEQTDIWAVGATMFNLLTGTTVHEGESAHHIVMLSATRPARPLASVLPDVPPEIASIVDRALAFDKAARWSTAEDLKTAIMNACQTLYGSASPDLQSLSATIEAAPRSFGVAQTLPSPVGLTPPRIDLSKTTGEPVSSSQPTSKRKLPGVITRALVRFSTTITGPAYGSFAFDFTENGRVLGPETPTPPRRRPLAWVIGAFAVACLVPLAIYGVRVQRLRSMDPGAASAAIEAPSNAPAEATASAAVVPHVTATTHAVAPPPSAPHASTVAKPPPAPPRPASRPAPAPAPTTSARAAGCSPPYYFDSSGIKRWKVECIQ